eukprot:TRINITY_DN112266_c0_g1_i1.p1 TRINITY_DN112266_c0_g1~~TRINITY_DN112266_c0_g1_i1.p1  ORF type:complete len:352 (+),score=78.52 TRINITY_DN112266_c0_g1_i1:131-1186(+)
MGQSSCCLGIKEKFNAYKTVRNKQATEIFYDCMDVEELKAYAETEKHREQLLPLLDQEDFAECDTAPGSPAPRLRRFYTAAEMSEIRDFHSSFIANARPASMPHTFSFGGSPWGNPDARGGERNSWRDIDGADHYKVRGPNYLHDKKKVHSKPALLELVLCDIFETDEDIKQLAQSEEAGILRRIRRSGETRRLFFVSFRVVPLMCVGVWALPDFKALPSKDEATLLLERFVGEGDNGMDDADRKRRFKVIPQVLEAPWVVKKVVGETPTIIGKQVPVAFHSTADAFEVSLGVCEASSSVTRLVQMLKHAASALRIEVNWLIEAQEDDELPERICGGFQIIKPEVATFRSV